MRIHEPALPLLAFVHSSIMCKLPMDDFHAFLEVLHNIYLHYCMDFQQLQFVSLIQPRVLSHKHRRCTCDLSSDFHHIGTVPRLQTNEFQITCQ